MKEPVWVLPSVIMELHEAVLAEHCGAVGIRELSLLVSALARARNLFAHGQADICALAAAFAGRIVRNHPFVDGNKRVAFVASYVFLRLNGLRLHADEASAAAAMLALAEREMAETEYARWLQQNAAPPVGP